MSNKPYKGFEPKWLLTPAPEQSILEAFECFKSKQKQK